jgi:hypothetical protein
LRAYVNFEVSPSPAQESAGVGFFLYPEMITSDNHRFINEHGIGEEELFDATGLSRQEYHQLMVEQNKIIAYGVEPCAKGHSLRTRSGHCVHCDSARLAFIRRHSADGQVYVAGSLLGEVIKIGSTSGKATRQESLNRTKYGGYDDWEILCTLSCSNSGEIEIQIGQILSKYKASRKYAHDGKDQSTYELFTCSYTTAIAALKQIMTRYPKIATNSVREDRFKSARYTFRNLTKVSTIK